MSDKTAHIAWILLAAAVVAWSGVGFFISTIQTLSVSRVAHEAQLLSASAQSSQVSSLQSLVSDTATERSELNAIAAVDPASLADAITSAGKSAGVAISITDANSVSSDPPVSGVTPTAAFSFVAAAEGSYASVIYATELLEKLPVPSSIQQIQLMTVPTASGTTSSSSGTSWQMNAQVKVLTASSTSL